jgi:hypothetical protein
MAALLLVGAGACTRAAKEPGAGQGAKEEAAAVQPVAEPPQVQPPVTETRPTAEAAPAAPQAPAPAKRTPAARHKARTPAPVPESTDRAEVPPAPPTPAPPPAPPVEGPGFERTATPPPPASPPPPTTAVVASGARLAVRLVEAIGTATKRTGDSFEAVLDRDLVADGHVVAPKGSAVVGKVASAVEPGRVEGRARMTIELTSIKVGGQEYPIHTNTMAFDAENTHKKDAAKIGGGAGLGAIIGAIAGGGKGAAIGAVVGGAAGTGTVLATRGKHVELKAEEPLTFRLEDGVTMQIVRE